MADKVDDGGPAFPANLFQGSSGFVHDSWARGVGGLSKREYFATHAPAPLKEHVDGLLALLSIAHRKAFSLRNPSRSSRSSLPNACSATSGPTR